MSEETKMAQTQMEKAMQDQKYTNDLKELLAKLAEGENVPIYIHDTGNGDFKHVDHIALDENAPIPNSLVISSTELDQV